MKKTATIEVEIRGKFSKVDFDKTYKFLKLKGKFLDKYSRLTVDLSPGFDPRTRSWKSDDSIDLRVKKSGDSEKIS